MSGSLSNKLSKSTDSDTGRPVIATLASPGKSIGAASVTISDATNWSTASKLYFSIFNVTTQGYKDSASQTDWVGTLSGTTISNLTLTGGTDRAYLPGATIEQTVTAKQLKDTYDLITAQHNVDSGAHTNITTTAITNNGNYNQSSGTFAVPNESISINALSKGSDADWVDYSSTATITGFASFNSPAGQLEKKIVYKQIGKTITLAFSINGTSNSGPTTITLPRPASNKALYWENGLSLAIDNGNAFAGGRISIDTIVNSSLLTCFANPSGGAFQATGQKIVRGQITYEAA